jgi:hypothetical protein
MIWMRPWRVAKAWPSLVIQEVVTMIPYQVLELGGCHVQEVGPGIEGCYGVHVLDELVLRQEDLEIYYRADRLKIVRVVWHQGVEPVEARHRVEVGKHERGE